MDLVTLFQLFKILPSLITLIEQIFPKATPGATKAAAVVGMVNLALPAAVTALGAAPDGQSHLVTAISAVVSGLNAANLMPSAGALHPSNDG